MPTSPSVPGGKGAEVGRFAAEGTNTGRFDGRDWTLLLATAGIWGSSFLWIAIGLDAFHPGVIAFGRMAIGAATVAWFPSARRRVPRSAWGPLVVVALAGNMGPAVFFPLAQQRVASSVAGMLNSVGPILVLSISIAMLRKVPPARQVVGLVVGMAGAVIVALPRIAGADAEAVGVLLVFAAVGCYSLSNNLLPRLAQTVGAPATMAWAMAISSVLLAPWGVWAMGRSEFAWPSAIALMTLGVFGTGLARTSFTVLNGRVGAPRSALVGYLVPIVAVVLGIVVRGESVGPTELAGTALILTGAALISR